MINFFYQENLFLFARIQSSVMKLSIINFEFPKNISNIIKLFILIASFHFLSRKLAFHAIKVVFLVIFIEPSVVVSLSIVEVFESIQVFYHTSKKVY